MSEVLLHASGVSKSFPGVKALDDVQLTLYKGEVLIFDEPTRGIDVGAKDEIYRLLETLAADGKSIIVISSELQEVLRVAHRIVVMSEGRVTGVLDNAEADQENVMHLATKYGHEKVDGDQ